LVLFICTPERFFWQSTPSDADITDCANRHLNSTLTGIKLLDGGTCPQAAVDVQFIWKMVLEQQAAVAVLCAALQGASFAQFCTSRLLLEQDLPPVTNPPPRNGGGDAHPVILRSHRCACLVLQSNGLLA